MKKLFLLTVACVVTFTLTAQNTQSPPPKATIVEYGDPITLEAAQKIMNTAIQESTTNGWTMAIAIVDTGGNLVLFERMNNTQIGSIEICIGKAKTANNFKRSTKVLEDAVAAGGMGLRLLGVATMTPLEGGEL